jgi:hypothetical protein
MNTDCGCEEIFVKDLLDTAVVRGGVRAIPTEAWTWSSFPVQDPILELIGNLRGRGICYPAVKNGKSTFEGILLTTASFERVVERIRSVCEEHFLRYEIEVSGTHLSIVIGDENFEPRRELFLFTSRFGDFAGIKFSIEIAERWRWTSKLLVETLDELRGLGHDMIDYKEIQLDGRRSCAIRLVDSMPKKQAWSKINRILNRTGWMTVQATDGVSDWPKTETVHFRKAGYLVSIKIQDSGSDNDETVILCKVSEVG